MKIKPYQLVGFALVIAGSIAVAYALGKLFQTGSCIESGPAFGSSSASCTDDTGRLIGEMTGGIFAVVIGIGLSGAFAFTFGGFFTGVGGYAAWHGLTHHNTAHMGAVIMGFSFLFVGIPSLLIGIGTGLSALRAPRRQPATMSAIATGMGLTPATAGAVFGSSVPVAPRAVAVVPPASRVLSVGGGDPLDRLKELADLKDRGILTADEFNAQKAKLLA